MSLPAKIIAKPGHSVSCIVAGVEIEVTSKAPSNLLRRFTQEQIDQSVTLKECLNSGLLQTYIDGAVVEQSKEVPIPEARIKSQINPTVSVSSNKKEIIQKQRDLDKAIITNDFNTLKQQVGEIKIPKEIKDKLKTASKQNKGRKQTVDADYFEQRDQEINQIDEESDDDKILKLLGKERAKPTTEIKTVSAKELVNKASDGIKVSKDMLKAQTTKPKVTVKGNKKKGRKSTMIPTEAYIEKDIPTQLHVIRTKITNKNQLRSIIKSPSFAQTVKTVAKEKLDSLK